MRDEIHVTVIEPMDTESSTHKDRTLASLPLQQRRFTVKCCIAGCCVNIELAVEREGNDATLRIHQFSSYFLSVIGHRCSQSTVDCLQRHLMGLDPVGCIVLLIGSSLDND
jgi:hypothetical protein